MNRTTFKQRGFTVVELIIVIIVIGILASITVVAYNGSQAKARDATRTAALVKIKDALEIYHAKNGRYPSATANPGAGGWEVSTDVKGTFLEQLYGYGVDEKTIDPTNDTTYRFLYYRYSAGSGSCDVTKGAFYVLRATYEQGINRAPVNDIQASECATGQAGWRADLTDTAYVYHAYEND